MEQQEFLICKLCGFKCKNYNGLDSHLRAKHPEFNTKFYYDIYIKKENEEFCNKCRKEVKYIRFGLGYEKFCEECIDFEEIVICPICNKKLKRLGWKHLKNHGLTTKDFKKLYPDFKCCNKKQIKISRQVGLDNKYRNIIPWNKGLTKETNKRIRKQGESHSLKIKGKPSNKKGKSKKEWSLASKKAWETKRKRYSKEEISKWFASGTTIQMMGRHYQTYPEKIFKNLLKEINKQTQNKYPFIYNEFLKTKPIGGRYPDFLIEHLKLVIEIDGEYWHQEKNFKRDIEFLNSGYTILHLPSKVVTKQGDRSLFLLGCVISSIVDSNLWKNSWKGKAVYAKSEFISEYTTNVEVFGLCQFQ